MCGGLEPFLTDKVEWSRRLSASLECSESFADLGPVSAHRSPAVVSSSTTEPACDIVEPSVAVPHLRAQPADGNSGEWFEAGAGPSRRCPRQLQNCRRG